MSKVNAEEMMELAARIHRNMAKEGTIPRRAEEAMAYVHLNWSIALSKDMSGSEGVTHNGGVFGGKAMRLMDGVIELLCFMQEKEIACFDTGWNSKAQEVNSFAEMVARLHRMTADIIAYKKNEVNKHMMRCYNARTMWGIIVEVFDYVEGSYNWNGLKLLKAEIEQREADAQFAHGHFSTHS